MTCDSHPTNATITVTHRLAYADDAVSELIQSALSFDRHHFRAGGTSGLQLSCRREVLAKRCDDGTWSFPTGLLDRMVSLLQSQNICVTIDDQRSASQSHDEGLLAQATGNDRAFLEAVLANNGGQILIRGDRDRYALCARLCQLFRHSRVLIVAPNKQAINDTYNGVGYPLAYNIGRTTSRSQMEQQQYPRLIATYRSGCLLDTSYDVVVHTHAEVLAGKDAFKRSLQNRADRVYSFLEVDQRLSPRKRLVVEGLCGPRIYETPHPRGELAIVRVVPVETTCEPIPGTLSAEQRMLDAVVKNARRNRMAADIAGCISGRDTNGLWAAGIPCPPHIAERLERDPPPRVLVVAYSPSHGRCLRRLLGDWPLFTGESGGRSMPARPEEQPKRSIITLVALHEQRRLDVDFIVWACGCSSPLNLGGFPPRYREGLQRSISVVDLIDSFDERAEHTSRDRLDEYVAAGLIVEGNIDSGAR